MKYANFIEAYLDGDMHASRIGLAVDDALSKLSAKNLIKRSNKLWEGMCSAAWAFHVQEQQELVG